jgi:hypothetical protein
MSNEKRNKDWNKAGLQVLGNDFDPADFHNWQSSAGECRGVPLRCTRTNTGYYMGHLYGLNRKTLIMGAGLLAGAIQERTKRIGGSRPHGNCSREECPSPVQRDRRKPLQRAWRPDRAHKLAPYCPPKYRRPGGIRTTRRK